MIRKTTFVIHKNRFVTHKSFFCDLINPHNLHMCLTLKMTHETTLVIYETTFVTHEITFVTYESIFVTRESFFLTCKLLCKLHTVSRLRWG